MEKSFEWDEEKRLSTLTKHGTDFLDLLPFFETDLLVSEARSDSERRRLAIGPLGDVFIALSCCRFRGHEDKIVTKETEIGHGETEVHEGVQV